MNAEPTNFLYPFIDADERDEPALLADLAASARAKIEDSIALRQTTLARCGAALDRAAGAIAARVERGGKVLAFGNGGSAADAQGAVELFRSPPSGRGIAALSLVDDQSVLTALANDIGVEVVFSRQVIAHGRPEDVALGFSTSGNSANVLRAFDEAHRRGLLTIAFSGYDGGAMAASATVDHCLVVHSDSVHRIQEAQAALLFALWSAVQNAQEACPREPSEARAGAGDG